MRGAKQILAVVIGLAAPLLASSVDRSTSFEARILAAHNRERASLNVQSLDWDKELAAGAKLWADSLARRRVLAHGKAERLGENLWAGTAGAYAPEEMVQLWVDERADFRPGAFPAVSKSDNLAAVGHYTQLIWRATSAVGCALSSNGRDDFLVCRYRRPGNVVGQHPI